MTSTPAPLPDVIEVRITAVELSAIPGDAIWAIRHKLVAAGVPLKPGSSLRVKSGALLANADSMALTYRWLNTDAVK